MTNYNVLLPWTLLWEGFLALVKIRAEKKFSVLIWVAAIDLYHYLKWSLSIFCVEKGKIHVF